MSEHSVKRPGVISVRHGTLARPTQGENLLKLISSGMVSSGDAIYIEQRDNATTVRHLWGVIQPATGMATVYIKHTPHQETSTAVRVKDIENFIIFNVNAFSGLAEYTKFKGLR